MAQLLISICQPIIFVLVNWLFVNSKGKSRLYFFDNIYFHGDVKIPMND